jgi:chromosome segregation ATPase
MVYNLNVITTAEQCDAVLADVNSEKQQLIIRRDKLNQDVSNSSGSISELPAEIADLDSKIAGLQSELAATTDPVNQMNINIEINALNGQRFRLQKKQLTFGSLPFVDRQFSLGKLNSKISCFEEFVLAIQARKTELQA